MEKLKMHFHSALPGLIYMVVYFVWFGILEQLPGRDYTIIHMKIDDKIPFCEYFIVPYLLWFFYVAWIIIYLFFKDKEGYKKCCIFLFSGMTVFLIISTLFPNIQYLRPSSMPRDNIFSKLVLYLYSVDTNTNIWPSIHVYNSLGVFFAVMNNERLSNQKFTRSASFFLTVAIILSTVFLKQHSLFDVMTACLMATFFYVIAYRMDVLSSIRKLYISWQTRKKHLKTFQ